MREGSLRRHAWLWATAVILAAAFVFNIRGYPLLDPDEGRNAEIMREMAETNDYVLPRLNELPYLDKPILLFAVGAAVMELLGPNELAARLPSLVFTVCTVLLVGWFAAREYGAGAATTAMIATAATPFTLAYSRTVIFDSALTFWVVLAVFGFYRALDAERHPRTRSLGDTANRPLPGSPAVLYLALAWGAMALGVLTKGPIALGLPLMIMLPYAGWRRRLRALWDPTALLTFAALVLPWVFAVSRELPDFIGYALGTETLTRLTTTALGRTGPFWYFIVILPAATLPWSVVAIAALRGFGRPTERRLMLYLLWVVIPLMFFSVSHSKRPQYVLPLVPAISLIVTHIWHGPQRSPSGVRAGATVLVAMGLSFMAGSRWIPTLVPATAEIAAAIPGVALVLGASCLLSGLAAWLWRGHRQRALLALSLPIAVIPFASTDLMAAIGHHRSARMLAQSITRVAPPTAQVIGVETFPLSLPFYLRRTVILSTRTARELTSNYLARDPRRWMQLPGTPLRHQDWWRLASLDCDRPRVFVVRSGHDTVRQELAERLPIIIDTGRYVALGPCGTTDLARAKETARGLRRPAP